MSASGHSTQGANARRSALVTGGAGFIGGWNMALNRYIKLTRGDRASVIEMLAASRRALRNGNSIMMFPEGTRSPDGRMRAFKVGAFDMAKDTGLPILPIVLDGTANALPKRGFVLQGRHDIRITILDEIPPETFEGESAENLSERVHELIGGYLKQPPASHPRFG